jgi:hypothetical protein
MARPIRIQYFGAFYHIMTRAIDALIYLIPQKTIKIFDSLL